MGLLPSLSNTNKSGWPSLLRLHTESCGLLRPPAQGLAKALPFTITAGPCSAENRAFCAKQTGLRNTAKITTHHLIGPSPWYSSDLLTIKPDKLVERLLMACLVIVWKLGNPAKSYLGGPINRVQQLPRTSCNIDTKNRHLVVQRVGLTTHYFPDIVRLPLASFPYILLS